MNDELKYVAKQVGIVLLVILLGLLVFAIGLVIGYGVIGVAIILGPSYHLINGRALLINSQVNKEYRAVCPLLFL